MFLTLHRLALPVELGRQRLQAGGGLLSGGLQAILGSLFDDLVDAERMLPEVLDGAQRVGLGPRGSGGEVLPLERFFEIAQRGGVEHVVHRVDVVDNLAHVLGLRHRPELVGIELGEVGVEVDEDLLVGKGFAVVGLALWVEHVASIVGFEALKLFAGPEGEAEVELVGRHFEAGGVGQHDLCAVETLVGLVDDGVVEHPRLGVLPFHVDVGVGDTVVEDALGDLHRRLRDFDGRGQCTEPLLGIGRNGVLEVERHAHERHHHAEDGRHDAYQRDARGLHGEEFEVFAHVAEGDERGQQDGQGQGGGHEGDAHVPEELPQDVEGEPFADQIVDPTPGELHHEDEQTNEESPHKEL